MTILKPTKEEVEEHLKECHHCRHWIKWILKYKKSK